MALRAVRSPRRVFNRRRSYHLLEGKAVRVDRVVGGKEHGALDDVSQLSHVPRPRILLEEGDGSLGQDGLRRAAELASHLGSEQMREVSDLVTTFAKRRDSHGECV